MENATEGLWTVEDVAKYLRCHVQTVYLKARSGEIPSVMIGSLRRFHPEVIKALADTSAAGDVG